MPLRHSLSSALAALLLLFTAGFYAPRASFAQDPVRLPIEVLGAEGHTETVTLQVSNPSNLNRLWLRVHRPGYRGQLKRPGNGAKASVRVNDGSWIDLTNETATIDAPDARFGGIGGEARTVRFSVPIDGVQQGANTVTFRFNGTDGLTSGYRVLALNFLRGGPQGAKALPQSAFAQDDPADWQPPLNNPSDIEEGERLWHEATLHQSDMDDSYLSTSCAGCHAEDGSDLKYFAYSNKSIKARAEFHGLSAQQGRQIASYIRSLELRRDGGAEYEAPGRPWNPPYQPGPGLDDKPVEAWPAGAGLEHVLDDDADMLASIFPGGITKDAIAPDETMSVTEQPIAMQLPDWNDWLPEIHPEDVWGNYFSETATIDEGPGKWRDDALGHYHVLRDRLENRGVPTLIQQGKLDNLIGRFTEAGIQFFLDNGGFSQIPGHIRQEKAIRSIRHWTVVKLWEVSHHHSLGDEAPQIYGDNGDARSWLGQARSLFELAPDLASDNGRSFRYQTLFEGKYASTAWYHLQLLLNSGNGSGGPIQPIDWSYHPAHVNALYDKVNGPAHPLRQTQAYAKLLQLYHTEAGLDGPFNVRQLHPVNYVLGGKYANVFDTMDPSIRPDVYGALLGALMDEMERFSESEWNAHRNANDLKSQNYKPKMVGSEPLASVHHQGRYADAWYSMIPIFDEDGVDADVLHRVVDWGEMMWPRGDWDAVRPQGGGNGGGGGGDDGDRAPGNGRGLTATYFADKTLSNEVLTRTDAEINFRWNHGAPDERIDANYFSARWTGDVEPLRSGDVTFHVSADDGARLWVDGELLVDQWHRGPVEAQGTLSLTAGERVPLRLEYREHRGKANVKLEWSSDGHGRRVVPQSQLYPSQGGGGGNEGGGEGDGATYEAEEAALAGAEAIDNHGGFSGDGYANFVDPSGAEITWTVEAAQAGQTSLAFRYALGSAPRSLELEVNGDVIDPSLTFGNTRSWTTWRTKSATVQLQAGSNTVTLRTTGQEGPNTDGLTVSGGGGQSYALQTARADQAASGAALGLPTEFALAGNYPNPFQGATTIQYALPEAVDVKLEVFDALGRRVAVLADERQAAGRREIRFDAAGMAPGVYFVRLKAGDFTGTQKAMLVR